MEFQWNYKHHRLKPYNLNSENKEKLKQLAHHYFLNVPFPRGVFNVYGVKKSWRRNTNLIKHHHWLNQSVVLQEIHTLLHQEALPPNQSNAHPVCHFQKRTL